MRCLNGLGLFECRIELKSSAPRVKAPTADAELRDFTSSIRCPGARGGSKEVGTEIICEIVQNSLRRAEKTNERFAVRKTSKEPAEALAVLSDACAIGSKFWLSCRRILSDGR
jgi:hypothetical protein